MNILNEKEAEVQDFIKEMERKHRMMFWRQKLVIAKRKRKQK